MYPPPNSDALGRRSRVSSFTDNDPTPLAGPRQRPEMTYFLADEKTMEASLSRSSSGASHSKYPSKRNFGVESLETTVGSLTSHATQESDDNDTTVGRAREVWKNNLTKGLSTHNHSSSRSPSPKSNISRDLSPVELRPRKTLSDDCSRPITPSYLNSPLLASTPGSPISRRGSESEFMTDDGASQAIMSSGEEDGEEAPTTYNGVTSQLVMPSLSLPSRKPFTEKGKNLGRLKIMIAGDSGIGKTSLIKAIYQLCDDIVHVDELSSSPLSTSEVKSKKGKSKATRDPTSTSQITEVYASTRAYPTWWSELDDSKVLRRRKSMGDSVLERNLCFVDTPGYGNGTSFIECIGPVVQYLETHLERSSNVNMTDSEVISMMSGSGGSQVDVVFYLMHQRIKQSDLEYLKKIAPLTNVIPIISKADKSTPDQLQALKANVLSQLSELDIRPFLFGATTHSALEPSSALPPWTVSTLAGTDPENMDASLLMSPDYISPLLPSQLSDLVEKVFDKESIDWLRHSTAKKWILYRSRTSTTRSQSLPQSLSLASGSSSAFSIINASQIVTPPLGPTSSYSLARITDHTAREERLAQVRLSNWAAELQRSIQNERLRFEALARGERAVWLTERLNECVQEGTIVPISQAGRSGATIASSALTTSTKGSYSRKKVRASQGVDRGDPLGLVKLNEEMQRRSWAALQIVGSFGILGGLAWWWSKGGWSGPAVVGQLGDGEGQGSWGLLGEWGRLVGDW